MSTKYFYTPKKIAKYLKKVIEIVTQSNLLSEKYSKKIALHVRHNPVTVNSLWEKDSKKIVLHDRHALSVKSFALSRARTHKL
jgi:hypothetical protein